MRSRPMLAFTTSCAARPEMCVFAFPLIAVASFQSVDGPNLPAAAEAFWIRYLLASS